MAHVFRLYTAGGDDTIEGWSDSNGYGTKAINSISDPEGSTCKREITSIPSPFARIDLMKNAFRQVVESGDLDNQTTIYHKLVSDCFDVAEIFFNIEKLRDKFDIITWNKKDSLSLLIDSDIPAHKQMGETLNMYLSQDAKAYNFDLLQNIYLLNYKGPGAPAQINIVGATSPVTLFFTSANNLNYVSQNVRFGTDKPFDTEFQPLYKRNEKFILYFFGLKNYWNQLQNNNVGKSFSNLFKEVDDYLNLTYTHLSQEQKNSVNEMTFADFSQYPSIPITNHADVVEVLGCELKCLNVDSIFKTDFTIDSDYQINGKKPLVLPVDIFRKSLIYTQDPWDNKTQVPVHDDAPIEQRKLPDDGRPYPYLTMGDFLEDTIICNSYPLNSSCFYNGGDAQCSEEGGYSYLLPIKKEYFQYFTMEDLKRHFRLERSNAAVDGKVVKAILEIPIAGQNGQKNIITYERFYYENLINSSDEKNGKIVVRDFALHIFPFLKVKKGIMADYRINVVDFATDDLCNLSFGNGKEILDREKCLERNKTEDGDTIAIGQTVFSPQTFIFKQAFSYIVFEVESIENIIIPEFLSKAGAKNFEFAVDFGTSNTHIECRIDNGKIEPFTISNTERLIQPINIGYGRDFDDVIMADFLPDTIGDDFRFPTRTVLSEKMGLDWIGSTITPMAESNLPFVFEMMLLPPYNKSHADLKWSNEDESKSRIQSYFENLIMLMRNKVLINGGNLASTKIVWFYPASMSSTRVKEIRDTWKELYVSYFGGDKDKQIITMSESIVPYYYYKKNSKATTNVVSVDIGGGTSDILIVKDGNPLYLSSCRFAANAIFDCQPCHSNPFVTKYIDKYRTILEANGMGEILELTEDFMNGGKSTSDIVMLLFSLTRNKDAIKKKLTNKLNYSSMLFSDPKLKILFLLFYTALIYHIARIMKCKSLDFPRHLTFSGTGSKILQILIDVSEKEILEKYTKLIFEEVYGVKYSEDGLDILLNINNPKEVTCKGGLIEMKTMSVAEIEDMKLCLLGTAKNDFVTPSLKYSDINQVLIDSVVKEIESFTSLFYHLNDKFSFRKNFGAMKSEELESLKHHFTRDIAKSIKDGISEKKSQDEVGETLFFYPIREILCAIGGNKKMLEREE